MEKRIPLPIMLIIVAGATFIAYALIKMYGATIPIIIVDTLGILYAIGIFYSYIIGLFKEKSISNAIKEDLYALGVVMFFIVLMLSVIYIGVYFQKQKDRDLAIQELVIINEQRNAGDAIELDTCTCK